MTGIEEERPRDPPGQKLVLRDGTTVQLDKRGWAAGSHAVCTATPAPELPATPGGLRGAEAPRNGHHHGPPGPLPGPTTRRVLGGHWRP